MLIYFYGGDDLKTIDIRVIGEGKQLKDFIAQNHSNIDLASALDLSNSTIQKYLNSKKITNLKFISKIEKLFNTSIQNMIISIEDQSKQMILNMKENIRFYNSANDNKNLIMALNLANNYLDEYYQLIARGNIALYKFNLCLAYEAEQLLEHVLKASENTYPDLFIYYKIRLAHIKLDSPVESIKILNGIRKYVNEFCIPNEILFNYYYLFGVLLNRLNKPNQSRKKLNFATRYCCTAEQTARVLLNIALTYFNESKYDKAIIFNNKALITTKSKDLLGAINNNLANIYMRLKDINKAREFANKAYNIIDSNFSLNRKLNIYDTLIELDIHNYPLVVKDIFKMLDNSNLNIENLPNFINTLNNVIKYLRSKDDLDSLKILAEKIIIFCNNKGNSTLTKELESVIGKIFKILITKGEIKL